MEGESILVCNQVDGDTQMTEATRTTNTMQVSFGHLGEVEVDDHVHGLDVDTAGEQVWNRMNISIIFSVG